MWKKIGIFLFICSLCYPSVIYGKDVILGGDSIGISIYYDGAYVISTFSFEDDYQKYHPSKYIQDHDVIQEINGKRIHSIDDFRKEYASIPKNEKVVEVSVIRNEKKVKTKIYHIYDESIRQYVCGLYLKDMVNGIGTLTYYDDENKSFAALGHEITNQDSKVMIPLYSGCIFPAKVTSIQKAQKNHAGEKHAMMNPNQIIGRITMNTRFGIYGKTINQEVRKKIPCASQDEIRTGKAYLYTVVEGEEIKPYEINITKLHKQNSLDEKGIEFEIVDEALLNKTGGIVQGMSGSPLVQNHQIIGAVTHVIVDSPNQGYGIYIETMLKTGNHK